MSLARCDHCDRAFRSVRWIDLRTGGLATGATFEHGEKAQLCWDCADAIDGTNAYSVTEATSD